MQGKKGKEVVSGTTESKLHPVQNSLLSIVVWGHASSSNKKKKLQQNKNLDSIQVMAFGRFYIAKLILSINTNNICHA